MIHEAIYWKKNNAPGISIVGDEIKDWPEALGEKPDRATIEQWIAEYEPIKAAADQAEADRIAAKIAAISDNLPSWEQVETAVNNIGNLADAKAFLRKLARVVYWLAKDKAD